MAPHQRVTSLHGSGSAGGRIGQLCGQQYAEGEDELKLCAHGSSSGGRLTEIGTRLRFRPLELRSSSFRLGVRVAWFLVNRFAPRLRAAP
jgi:hypothetical protein